MSTRALTWLAGAQCLLLGALILVAPHQFAGRLYSPLQPHLVAWGGVFVVSGASLLATAALALAGRVRALAHLIAGGALLALGIDLALGTAWVSSINYLLLGVATVLVPLLGRPEPRRGDVPRSALGLTVGAAVISTGIYLVITPQGEPNDARLWNGVAFVGGGLMLMAWTAWPKLRGVSVLSRLFVAAACFAFIAINSLPARSWTSVLLFGGYGLALLLVPLLRRLESVEGPSLRTRFALALCAAATLPLVIASTIDAQRVESINTDNELALNTALADGIARDTERLLDGSEQALRSIARVPGLLNYPPETQTALLRGLTMVPPVRNWGTFDAAGRAIARSDAYPLTDISAASIYGAARDSDSPVVDFSSSPFGRPPVVQIAVSIRDIDGQVSGLLVLETDQITQSLFSIEDRPGARIYLVDAAGRRVAERSDESGSAAATGVSLASLEQAIRSDVDSSDGLAYGTGDQEWLAGFASVPSFGWIVVERPALVALEEVHRSRDVLFGLLVTAATLAVIAGLLVAGWLAEPLKVLAAAVKHVGSGGTNAPLPHSRVAEVALLAENFADMRDRLAERTVQREHAEAELRSSEEQFRFLFASNPQPMWVYKQSTLELVEVNAAATETYGWSRQEFLNMRITDLRTPAEAARLLSALARGDRTGLESGESVHRLRNGQTIEVQVAARHLSFGGIDAALGIAFDISARKRTEQGLHILAQASEVLAGSLDYESTLRRVARLAVPIVADFCIVHVVTDDTEIRQVEVAHVNPAKLELALELQRRYPSDVSPERGVRQVIRTGQPQLLVEISDEMLAASGRDADHVRLLREIGLRSAIVVPMRAHDKVLGTITLVYADSERQYSAADLPLTEDLARRCAQAIENALLYRAARDAEAELQRQLDFTRTLTESLGEGVYATDVGGDLTFLNPAGRRILGWDPDGLGAPNVHARVHVHRHQRNGQSTRSSEAACPLNGEPASDLVRRVDDDIFTREDGTLLPVSYSAAPIVADGKRVGTVVAFRDVSELKRAEQEIRGLNAGLEQRIDERTAELLQANRELDAFAYTVSHDLRAPLRAMDGFSRIVIEEHGEGLTTDGRRYLGIVRENALQMGRLIDDLLSFSRLGRRALSVQPVRPDDIVRQIVVDLTQEDTDRHVDITIADLPSCLGDPSLLRQVFVNLVSNALKYTRQRQLARIEIGYTDTAGETVYWVRDNGVGFDMRYAHKLFGVFQRLHRAEDYEGTGVGLALVQRIVQRHGGRVWAESAPDQGATFYFTLGGQSN